MIKNISVGIIGLGFFAAAIAYNVFGIMYLVEDYTVCHDCKGSNLWNYALVSIVFSFITSKVCASIQQNKMELWEYILKCTIIGIMQGSLAIWGGIELFEKSCHAVENSHLWKWGTWAFGLQCFSVFVCISPLLYLIFYILYTSVVQCIDMINPANEPVTDIETGESTVVDG